MLTPEEVGYCEFITRLGFSFDKFVDNRTKPFIFFPCERREVFGTVITNH
jgi:hypothetical protein